MKAISRPWVVGPAVKPADRSAPMTPSATSLRNPNPVRTRRTERRSRREGLPAFRRHRTTTRARRARDCDTEQHGLIRSVGPHDGTRAEQRVQQEPGRRWRLAEPEQTAPAWHEQGQWQIPQRCSNTPLDEVRSARRQQADGAEVDRRDQDRQRHHPPHHRAPRRGRVGSADQDPRGKRPRLGRQRGHRRPGRDGRIQAGAVNDRIMPGYG